MGPDAPTGRGQQAAGAAKEPAVAALKCFWPPWAHRMIASRTNLQVKAMARSLLDR